MEIVKDFLHPTAVVIKHNNPTGVASSAKLADAYLQAWTVRSLLGLWRDHWLEPGSRRRNGRADLARAVLWNA